MKLKERRHEYLQKRALDKAIYKLIGDYGTYSIYDWEVLVFNFDSFKMRNLEQLEFNLPSKEEIIIEAKKIYKKFDGSNIEDIQYNFSFLGCSGYCPKNQDLILNANGSIIKLSSSSFKSIEIKDANKVFVYCKSLSDIKIKSKFVSLYEHNDNLNTVDLECDKIDLNFFVSLYAKKIIFKALNMDLGNSTLNAKTVILKAKTINSKECFHEKNEISGEKIILDADFIDIKDTKLKASEAVIIKDKSCTPIQSICSPKIVYNNKDISNNDEIVIQKLRKKLLYQLKSLRYDINNKVDNIVKEEVESYKKKYEEKLNKSLNNEPITKILRK